MWRCRASAGAVALSAAFSLPLTPALPETPVALELVLAVDVSTSIDRREYALQMRGLAEAFRSRQVIEAITGAAPGGIAVALLQWAGTGEHKLVVPWRFVRDTADAEAMAARVDVALRLQARGGTAIGEAIQLASRLFDENGYAGQRRVVDVSGDGRANQGLVAGSARDAAVARGITINGLAILNEEPALDLYYQLNVIGGAQAFVLSTDDFKDFARAIRAKLVREIAGMRLAGSDIGAISSSDRPAFRRGPLRSAPKGRLSYN